LFPGKCNLGDPFVDHLSKSASTANVNEPGDSTGQEEKWNSNRAGNDGAGSHSLEGALGGQDHAHDYQTKQGSTNRDADSARAFSFFFSLDAIHSAAKENDDAQGTQEAQKD
jgi:hypothetical protein